MKTKNLRIQMLKEFIGSELHKNTFKVKSYKVYIPKSQLKKELLKELK